VLSIFGTKFGPGSPAAGSVFNFNGGTLKAVATNNADFLNLGGMPVVLSTNGAIIDSGVFDITVTNALLHDSVLGGVNDGGLVKLGAGKLTLAGTNTYTGPTIVSNGTLVVPNLVSISNSTALLPANGAILDLSSAGVLQVPAGTTVGGWGTISDEVFTVSGAILSPGGSNSIGTLTISSNLTVSSGAVYNWQFNGTGSTSDAIHVCGNLSLPAVVTVNVSCTNETTSTRLPLFVYDGACDNTDFSGWVINGRRGFIQNEAANHRIVFFRSSGTIICIR
jgi:fibronectin-binding autotransporter adhesin